MINRLLANDLAYASTGIVYFAVKKFKATGNSRAATSMR